jgi:hypothetical protein
MLCRKEVPGTQIQAMQTEDKRFRLKGDWVLERRQGASIEAEG